ncbi:MAG: 16S rRNA (cytidine(1402)-2'-O)-methyltransferase [Pseudomonadota bacterium]
MNFVKTPLVPGLYIVATPIGTARDITLRALDILASADLLVAEDTRTLRKLLDLHAIALEGRAIISYHDHSKSSDRARILRAITVGQSVAYVSEAGTPLIADPGYALVQEVRDLGALVTGAPGPSAPIAALSIAGLPTDRFFFAGFAPATQHARRAHLSELKTIPATLVFFEAPKRVSAFLDDAASIFGDARQAALCREITKRFEEVRRGTLPDLHAGTLEKTVKGECVILISKAMASETSDDDILAALKIALTHSTLKEAATAVSGGLGVPRRQVYQMALALKSGETQ